MICRYGAVLLLAAALPATAAEATSLPAIKSGGANEVPACATPGRLMEFLKWRNPGLEPRFGAVPVDYMRYGEELGLRWDYAFFQMIVETGGLTFKRSNGRAGDVKAAQNNFAGLGATGKGASGESFPDVASGVKAHLQHVLIYAGETIADPVAERTRKVQEWGVLTPWLKGLKEPVTYSDLARKWAPGSNGYAGTIEGVAKRFYDDFCDKPDPQPELVAEARKGRSQIAAEKDQSRTAASERVSGAELARQARERARRAGDGARSSLGFGISGAATAQPTADAAQLAPMAPRAGTDDVPAASGQRPATVQTASAAASAKPAAAPKAPPAPKCRVWTASYGGLKSVIIRSVGDQQTNYTVLDVNEGAESREVEAYVAAYAKGGQKVGEFSNQSQALEKAFELCPEG